MREEDRDAVGDRDSQCETAPGRDMAIGIVHSQPARPVVRVRYDSSAVNLVRGSQTRPAGRQLVAELSPSLHDEGRGLLRGKAEGARGSSGRECSDSE